MNPLVEGSYLEALKEQVEGLAEHIKDLRTANLALVKDLHEHRALINRLVEDKILYRKKVVKIVDGAEVVRYEYQNYPFKD